MKANDQELSLEEAEAIQAKLEQTFLSILNEDDDHVKDPNDNLDLSDEQRATLKAVIESEMPTPEQIIERAKLYKHNQEVQQRREERLARRMQRQGKPKRRRR